MTQEFEVLKFLRDHKFIVDRQNKEFVLYGGLLHAAHELGLVSLTTELVQMPSEANNNTAIFKAAAVMRDQDVDRTFIGHGDASPANVGRMIAAHFIRMAETRAKARALRDAINVGSLTSLEEIGDQEEAPAPSGPPVRLATKEQRAQLRAYLDAGGKQDTPIPDNLPYAVAARRLAEIEAMALEEQKKQEAQPEAVPPSAEQVAYLEHLMSKLMIKGTIPKNATVQSTARQINLLEERLAKLTAEETPL